MTVLFWVCLFIAFYTFLGYGLVLCALVYLRRWRHGRRTAPDFDAHTAPTATLVVASYNEAYILKEKIINTLSLAYPPARLKLVFVTDGSNDHSAEILAQYPEIMHLHRPERLGKIAAVHRAMQYIDTEIVVFTDANTFLNAQALQWIARHYAQASVGAVSGEKRVYSPEANAAAGEGLYWKYESLLKKWDSELYSVVGAAGELFSVRSSLYQPVPADTILDDFMISLRIAEKGYRIVYEPEAYAMETSSANVGEELKRKVRIAAGGIQSIVRLKSLLNLWRFPVLGFQYISHRVLRWTITPFCLVLALLLNVFIVWNGGGWLYQLLLAAQGAFYAAAGLGWLFEQRKLKVKAFFVPYYFCMMNYAVVAGILRYIKGSQSAAWEKSARQAGKLPTA